LGLIALSKIDPDILTGGWKEFISFLIILKRFVIYRKERKLSSALSIIQDNEEVLTLGFLLKKSHSRHTLEYVDKDDSTCIFVLTIQ